MLPALSVLLEKEVVFKVFFQQLFGNLVAGAHGNVGFFKKALGNIKTAQ
jgi:hypothetical protein